MATSGTYSFTMTRDDIIGAALRALEVYGAGDTISAQDLVNCTQALNIMCKALVVKGLPLWCVQDITVPLVVGQAQYSIGPSMSVSQSRPLRILDAYLRFQSANDVTLEIVSRYDYDTLGAKATPGTPNQLFYDPQLQNGIVTLYNVPSDATAILHLVIQRQFQDFNLATDNPDFPPEAFQMLKWLLADEISSEYGAKAQTAAICAGKALTYRNDLMNFEQEQGSVFFYPSGRRN